MKYIKILIISIILAVIYFILNTYIPVGYGYIYKICFGIISSIIILWFANKIKD